MLRHRDYLLRSCSNQGLDKIREGAIIVVWSLISAIRKGEWWVLGFSYSLKICLGSDFLSDVK